MGYALRERVTVGQSQDGRFGPTKPSLIRPTQVPSKTKIKRDYQSTASSAETGHPDVQIRITISLLISLLAAG